MTELYFVTCKEEGYIFSSLAGGLLTCVAPRFECVSDTFMLPGFDQLKQKKISSSCAHLS